MGAIPKIVFDHFRKPRNKGLPEKPTVVGRVSGRAPDSQLRLALVVKDGVCQSAGFDAEGDRSCDAILSMTTCYIAGRAIVDLERLTIEELGEAYELNDEQIPMFVPAFEALQSALAFLAGRPDPFAFEGGMICTCLNVREGRIRRSIREKRLKTVEDVAHWTRACTGCRSCRTDIQRILIDEERRKK